jgi:hypothetical protein
MSPRAASLAVVLLAAVARADPPPRSAVTVDGVRLDGEMNSSSTGVRREPGYVLTNLTGSARAVELVALAGLGADRPRPLPIEGARRIVLAPHETRSLRVAYTGQPVNLGGGLSYYRFSLTIAVGGRRASALATNAYMCRIPVRHLSPP